MWSNEALITTLTENAHQYVFRGALFSHNACVQQHTFIIGDLTNIGSPTDVIDSDCLQPGQHNENTRYLSSEDLRLIMDAKHAEDISIIYLNIGSLPAHIDELQNFLFTSNCYPTIIALAETKITQTVNTEFHPHLDNYTYLNIASSISCGSVGVFIKNINYTVRDDLNIWKSKMWETLWLEIDFNKTKNFIGVVYPHPTGEIDIPFFSRSLEIL